MKNLILLLLLTSLTGFSQALDFTFNTTGIGKYQVSNIPSSNIIKDGAVQSDGKMVYVGTCNLSGFMARYDMDGVKDPTFNQYGFLKIGMSPQTLAIQNDGKIVVAGLNNVRRVLSNGVFDSSFTMTSISYNAQNMNIKHIIFQTDSKIVLSGFISNGIDNDFAVARLNSDGSLDATFDADGILIIPMSLTNDQAYSNKIQADGKIVVFGETQTITGSGTSINVSYTIALVRVNTDGSLDTTFGTNGKVINVVGRCVSGEVLTDGRLISIGNTAIARFTILGTLDTTLNGTGKLSFSNPLSVSGTITINSVPNLLKSILLSDESLLISGSNNGYKVVKLTVNGSTYLPTLFSITPISTDYSTFLTQRFDGKFVTGGYSNDGTSNILSVQQILLNNDGSTDTMTTLDLYLSKDYASYWSGNILQLNDQSYLVPTNDQNGNLTIIKILSNGIRDMSFGNFGVLRLGQTWNTRIYMLSDGKIILNDYTSLYKMDVNGVLDVSFGSAGVLDLSISYVNTGVGINNIEDFIISNDNKFLLACDYNNATTNNDRTAVIKLNTDGTFDSSFANNGMFQYSFSGNQSNFAEYPTAICQDNNNKIVLCSVYIPQYSNPQSIYISKLNSDGSFDTSFGSNGIYVYDATYANTFVTKITSNFNNAYLLSYYNNDPLSSTHTLKINNNGGIDTTFGSNGVVDASGAYYFYMALQSDGKILKGGEKNKQFSIIRYNADGSVDNTFGMNGELNTSIDFYSTISNFLIQADGKLQAIGSSFNGNRELLTMIRYTSLNLGDLDLASASKSLMVYPNPIEKEAIFQYSLPNDEKISIFLVDLQGRVVKNIISNENQNAGLKSVVVSFDGTLCSGNYFLTIASSSGKQTVQVIKK
jgi:uncharacterized delta-60 repeat protein